MYINIVYCPLPRQGTRCAHEGQKRDNDELQWLEQHPHHDFSTDVDERKIWLQTLMTLNAQHHTYIYIDTYTCILYTHVYVYTHI